MELSEISYEQIKLAYNKFKFRFFQSDQKDYNINLWGIRSEDLETDLYNDVIGVSWMFRGNENHYVYKGTTDPGLFYLKKPMSVNGAALLVHNRQYRGCYRAGIHRQGSPTAHEAFCQVRPMLYWRDNDRDNYRDIEKGRIFEGIYGTNLHSRRRGRAILETIGKTSAGCQVVQDVNKYHKELMKIRDNAVLNWGNSFTYTLFFERDIRDII